MPTPTTKLAALALADTMLAGSASLDALVAACARVFEQDLPWAHPLCLAVLARTQPYFHDFSRHELADILEAMRADLAPAGALSDLLPDPLPAATATPAPLPLLVVAPDDDWPPAWPPVRHYCLAPPLVPPAPAWRAALALPPLASSAALASWLGEPPADLAWLADRWRLAGAAESPLQHYHYRWLPKHSGGARLIEVPKARLRRLQRLILRRLLDRVPPHAAAHGFRRAHSCLTHAALHAGRQMVIRMDLQDFFPSIAFARIHALFEKLGYPPPVAATLARLCTNRTPRAALAQAGDGDRLHHEPAWAARQALRTPHLPQGAPSSPALANLCAYRLDLRLDALARSLGATYSRYADDLVFSGDGAFAAAAARLVVEVACIALDEGFRVNHRKTKMMRQGVRQQVTGMVVNRHPNIARDAYDRLKAILTNCVRHGPASQNRDGHADFRAHLAGRISHVAMLNPARGAKLSRLAARIAWP